MARRVNFASELEEIGKSGLKQMQLSKRESGAWFILMNYDCGCEGQVDLNTLLDGSEGGNRVVLEALRLAYSCARHPISRTKSEHRTEAHA
jgi:hypothetical protein